MSAPLTSASDKFVSPPLVPLEVTGSVTPLATVVGLPDAISCSLSLQLVAMTSNEMPNARIFNDFIRHFLLKKWVAVSFSFELRYFKERQVKS